MFTLALLSVPTLMQLMTTATQATQFASSAGLPASQVACVYPPSNSLELPLSAVLGNRGALQTPNLSQLKGNKRSHAQASASIIFRLFSEPHQIREACGRLAAFVRNGQPRPRF